jgi:hypothetical protein
MAYLTREQALAELAVGQSFLFGDPEQEVPLPVLDLEQKGAAWAPVVPAEVVRGLIRDGLLAVSEGEPSPEGKQRYRLAR